MTLILLIFLIFNILEFNSRDALGYSKPRCAGNNDRERSLFNRIGNGSSRLKDKSMTESPVGATPSKEDACYIQGTRFAMVLMLE